mgnify:CR=1 FL=1
MPAKNPITDTKAFRDALGTEPDPVTGRRFGVSTQTVQAYRRAAGIPSYVEVRRAQVDALVAACDRSTSAVAREAGVSRRAVTKRRAALGEACPVSPFVMDAEAKRAGLLAYVAENPTASVAEAARAVGLSRSRAYAILGAQNAR